MELMTSLQSYIATDGGASFKTAKDNMNTALTGASPTVADFRAKGDLLVTALKTFSDAKDTEATKCCCGFRSTSVAAQAAHTAGATTEIAASRAIYMDFSDGASQACKSWNIHETVAGVAKTKLVQYHVDVLQNHEYLDKRLDVQVDCQAWETKAKENAAKNHGLRVVTDPRPAVAWTNWTSIATNTLFTGGSAVDMSMLDSTKYDKGVTTDERNVLIMLLIQRY